MAADSGVAGTSTSATPGHSPDGIRTGLTSREARARLTTVGPNRMPVAKSPPAWRSLLHQMVHFFAVMLWIASVLAFAAGLPQLAVAIGIVIIINGVFAFVQEHRAEHAAQRLRDLLPRRATVMRDGRVTEIDATELVPGDLVQLVAGDHISADLSILEAHSLAVDTSTLTGETVPVSPSQGEVVHAGTWVILGEALAEVVATGSNTRLAGIAAIVARTRRPPTPLALELRHVVRLIATIAVLTGVAFFGIGILVGIPPADGFLFAIGVTVALVPEGLLPTVSLSLAMGAQRMAKRNALVRRLEAVETLGSTTFICTDKTGTLTRNEMEVVELWTLAGRARIQGHGYGPEADIKMREAAAPAIQHAAIAAKRCSTGTVVLANDQWTPVGDPMEAAIDALTRRLGLHTQTTDVDDPVTQRFPFDADRRRMSIVTRVRVLVKGAPDAVIPHCRETTGALEALESMAANGLRVLAVAERPISADVTFVSAQDAEQDLNLLGLIGLEDPPREGIRESLRACREAGIRVAMVTGDHPRTAEAVANAVGLSRSEPFVVEGHNLPADDSALGELLDRDGVVVSRVTPEDKLRIARALRARGHIVAMTGDGVNDGPALQEANIGVAMGKSGTDVAREAADLILLDDHFATIVDAIREGRATFNNTRRFLTYHLTDNVAQLTPFVIWAASGGTIPLALSVLQILVLDIVTDTLPAVALGGEPAREQSLKEPPYRTHLLNRDVLRRVFGILGPTEAIVVMAAFIITLLTLGWSPGDGSTEQTALYAASGAAFAAIVIGQIGNAFACRSTTRWPGALGLSTNRLLLVAVTVQALALIAFLFLSPLSSLLEHGPPTTIGWAVALLAAPAVIAADAIHKHWRRHHSTSAPRIRATSGEYQPSAEPDQHDAVSMT